MDSKGRAFIAELFRFHLVGVGTLLIGTLVFLALLALHVDYMIALAADYAAGIVFSYYMNKTFTFRAKVASDIKPLSLTILGYLVTFLLNLLLLAGAVELLSLSVVYSQLGIMLLLAMLNFLFFKFVIFGMNVRNENMPASSVMLASEYPRMAAVEADMWWFTSLHADLLDVIREHFGQEKNIRILDAGCGTGGFLRYARRRGYANCKGLDFSPLAVDYCRQQGLDVLQGSITDKQALANAGKADVIVAIDVICSLPDEQQRIDFFREANELLNDGGLLLVQTPAFRCLGGIHDLAVGVNRRYTKTEVQLLLQHAGIQNCRLRYRLLLLAPLVLLKRTLQRLQLGFRSNVAIESDVKMPSALLNSLLFHLQRMEDKWLPFRPFGSSLQILIKKARQA